MLNMNSDWCKYAGSLYVHSHTRRAIEAECSAEEIYHMAFLGTTTLASRIMAFGLKRKTKA
jgi:hypothetical protein